MEVALVGTQILSIIRRGGQGPSPQPPASAQPDQNGPPATPATVREGALAVAIQQRFSQLQATLLGGNPAPAQAGDGGLDAGAGVALSNDQSVSVTLETLDGDTVTLTLNSNTRFGAGVAAYADASAGQVTVDRAGQFSFTVNGSLDAQELTAISALVKRLSRVAEQFFEGSLQKALNKARLLAQPGRTITNEIDSFDIKLRNDVTLVGRTYAELGGGTPVLGDGGDATGDPDAANGAPAAGDGTPSPGSANGSTATSAGASAEGSADAGENDTGNGTGTTDDGQANGNESGNDDAAANAGRALATYFVELRSIYTEFRGGIEISRPGEVIADLLDAAFETLRARDDLEEADDAATAQGALRDLLLRLDGEAPTIDA